MQRSRLLLTVTCCLASLVVPAAQSPNAWTQFRGNPALTGVSSSTPSASLEVVWSVEAGESIESSAAIADGRVFVGVASGHLLALNLADGRELWKYPVEQGIGESSPAVSGGLVYIGDLGGVFHAVNVADGKVAWTFRTKGEIKSSPVVVGDRVLIGSYDTHLYALSARDGKLLWSVKTDNYVHGTPAVSDGLVYLAGCDEVFRAIRLADGVVAFRVPTGAYTGASVALDSGKAYFGNFNNEVVGFDLKTRDVTWRYSHPERKFPFYSSAAVANDTVVVGGRDKMVRARGLVTRHRGRPRLRRVARRPVLRPRPRDGSEAVGVRRGRADLGISRHCRWTHRHRLAGRTANLLRLEKV